MKKSNTVLLLVFLFIIIAGAVLWWIFIGWAKDASESGRESVVAGREFGKTSNASGCLKQALVKEEQCEGITCGIHNKVFLSSCLDSSQPEPQFCNDVPSSYSILQAAAWELEQCEKIGNEKPTCQHLFRTVHTYCTQRDGKN